MQLVHPAWARAQPGWVYQATTRPTGLSCWLAPAQSHCDIRRLASSNRVERAHGLVKSVRLVLAGFASRPRGPVVTALAGRHSVDVPTSKALTDLRYGGTTRARTSRAECSAHHR